MLIGKTAIITGGSRGIGLAVLRKFAKNHASIFLLIRKLNTDLENEINILKKENDVFIEVVLCDLSDNESVKSAVRTISKHTKQVDILVNNAGTRGEDTAFQMMSLKRLESTMQVNFMGLSILTQYVLRLMKNSDCGSIVNMTSFAGIDGVDGQYDYVCSKAAIIGATKELAKELGKFNIRVNAVAPSFVETEMVYQIDKTIREKWIDKIILNRMAQPDEIADVVLFLASGMSSYITGQVLRVDGGIA